MTHGHFESTFSKYAFGRGGGGHKKEYAVYARENDDNYGRPLMQFVCSCLNAVRKDFKEEAWCSEEFHFLSLWCDLLPCVVLVFPTCEVFSSLGLAVSTFLLYLVTENALWSEDSYIRTS